MLKIRTTAATALTAAVLSAGALAAPASAATIRPDAGWLGACTPQLFSDSSGGGWCDGNGPDYHYKGWVRCANGQYYYGVERWAGDRRGSYNKCPSPTWLVAYGVIGFHV